MDVYCLSYIILLQWVCLFLMVRIYPFLNQSYYCSIILESLNRIFAVLCSSSVRVSNLTILLMVNSNCIHLFDMMTLKYSGHYDQVEAYFFQMLQTIQVKFCFWLILYDSIRFDSRFDWSFFFVGIILISLKQVNFNFYHPYLSKVCFLFRLGSYQFALF